MSVHKIEYICNHWLVVRIKNTNVYAKNNRSVLGKNCRKRFLKNIQLKKKRVSYVNMM